MNHHKIYANHFIKSLCAALSTLLVFNTQAATTATSVAVGTGAKAANGYDVAIGSGAFASGNGSAINMATAVGAGAQASNAGAIALGDAWAGGAVASGRDSIAMGTATRATQQSAIAIGSGATATQANAVALGAGSVTSAAVKTSSATINGLTYTLAGATPASTISIGSTGNERTITNMAAGRISATSTDAVNGSELYAATSSINAIGSQVNGLGGSFASAIGGGSSYNSATGALTVALNYGGGTYASLQSVLDQINGSVSGGGIKYFHVNATLADSSAQGSNSVSIGPAAAANTNNAVAIGNGATAGANAGDVALGAGSTTSAVTATSGATIGGTAYTFAGAHPTSTISVGSAGSERTITHVAAGQIDASSTDAVNGSELYATNQQVGANTAAIKNLSSSVNNIVSGGANNRYYQANATGAASSATGANALAAGPAAVAKGNSSMAMGAGATSSAANGIAIGAGSSAGGADSVAIGAGSIDEGQSNVVSVGSSAQQRRITHVAAGSASSDAVNVSQLDAAQASAVQYDRDSDGGVDYGDVTLGANGSAAQIHGVANGVASSDAANMGQLSAGIQSAENWAKNYTDQRLQGIDQSLNTIAARANAGVASAMAMAGLPQAYRPNQNAATVAFGTFHGQAGMAVGMSTVSESGRWVYKLNVTGNTRGDAGASVGAAVTW